MRPQITIALVKYQMKEEYFQLSFFTALAQFYENYKIKIYLEDVEFNYYIPGKRIEVVRLPHELFSKPAKVREYIVKDCDTKYLAFWDSDDFYTVDRLYEQFNLAERKMLNLVYSNFYFISNKGCLRHDYFTVIGLDKDGINILDENYIGLGISFYRTEFIKSLLPFPDILLLDWWLAVQTFNKNGKIGRITKPQGYYRIYKKSLSQLMNQVKPQLIEKEIENKLELYSNIDSTAEIEKRIKFYTKLKDNYNYKEIISDFNNREYKNPWGGLVRYHE